MIMSKKHYDSVIRLGIINTITSVPEKDKTSFYKPIEKYKKLPDCYGILTERRNHKVVTDEHKLFGTKKTHKYY